MMKMFFNGLRFYWRMHLGVLLGTVLAAAVLTGSLLVGDSVDGSLRKFALQRLGGIQSAMYTPNRFFSSGLAEKIPDSSAALQLRGMAITDRKQVSRVQVLGTDSNFWNFAGRNCQLQENETALNQKLATALGVRVGDEISLRIEKPGLLPGDAPLASQKDDRTVRGRFTVKRILSDDELGRFSLSANQVAPYNAFVNLQGLANRTDLAGKANLILAGAGDFGSALKKVWTVDDFGFRFRQQGATVQLESGQVYLEPEAVRAALSIQGAEGTLTYLVNSISKEQKSTPYSFVLAREADGLRDNEIIINRWLADELSAKTGDPLTMKYFELLPSGRFKVCERVFTVRRIAEMNELSAERELAPQFPGLTDVDRCADWDVGIPMEQAALEDKANEEYWNNYRQTPKAIVSLTAGQEMWSNRFGSLTSVRWPQGGAVTEDFRNRFDPAAAGFVFQPVREQALAAVDNAMDFGQLFIGMSFFLIVAALMLTGLLFVFGVQQRAEEMGILLATGWEPSAVRRLFFMEGGAIALAGSAAGAWLGTGYTKLLILGLATYWQGAVTNSAIQYFARPETVVTGALVSFVCAILSMGIAMWRQTKHPARELLMADFSQEFESLQAGGTSKASLSITFPILGIVVAAGVVVYALTADVQNVTMPFFGAGALLLVSGVLFCGIALRRAGRRGNLSGIAGMALRNAARRRGRSLTVIGLLACGCFLVFAVSSMKEDVTAHADKSWSGTGGFRWFGESTLPVTDNPGGVRLRVRDGDDASCLNLNRAQSPRLLGVDPDAMSQRKAFLADDDFWQLLKLELPDGAVPALVGDADTAMWGLEAKTGVEQGALLDHRDEAGNVFKVKLVGRLPMRLSVFQGTILIAEQRFVEKFPGEEGYRMFLFDDQAGGTVAARKYARDGMDVVPSTERLMEFYAVESTYLAMFLLLGALGLAVGSMGMGVVVLRNVQDRRTEIALLRAVGYRNRVLRKMLFIEHGLLLAAGLGVGVVASAVAMVPALVISTSQVSAIFLIGLLAAIAGCGALCMIAAVSVSLRGDALRGLRNE
jgi:ABC-type lipoprotein release transport system permease subunit